MKPVIYIASPYTSGCPDKNTEFQCRIWHRLMDDGVVWPVAPLWSHFQHLRYPRHYTDWINYDLALLDRYDGCLRLAASLPESDYYVSESTGADGEVAHMRNLGKPVFFSIEEMYGRYRLESTE